MNIDILIAVAEKGGVENTINALVSHVQKVRGWNIRVVQLVWEGVCWTKDEKNFFPLLYGRKGHTLDDFIHAYADFVKENGEADVVLATAWPYMCYVAKKVYALLGNRSIKVISWLHAPAEKYIVAGYGGYEHLALADAHLAISKLIYNEIKNRVPGSVVFSVRNPIAFDDLVMANTDSIEDSKRTHKLYFVGRVSEEKRLDIVIRALEYCDKEWQLYIVGDGEAKTTDYLKKLSVECRTQECIHWLGWKERPWSFAHNADALVLASDFEGFPLVAIEALSRGIPVISTPVSGIIELLKPGINGYLYPNGDSKSLSQILLMMSHGELPIISKENCIASVRKYQMDEALLDFEAKIEHFFSVQKDVLKLGEQSELYSGDKISVIIPSYNAEKHIETCINSLLEQTLSLERMELIFVDDASQDGTCSIIRKYENLYPENILFVSCEENAGPGVARNIGLSYASGNYIAFVDADDKVVPEMLQKLYEKIVMFNCDMAGCSYAIFNDEGLYTEVKSEEKVYDMHLAEEKKQYIIKHGCKNSVWSHIYRKDFLDAKQILFPEMTYMEDVYFHQVCMMQAERCYESSDILYMYRKNPDGIMHGLDSKHLIDVFDMQDSVYRELLAKDLHVGYEEELALLYYVKAFVEPIYKMEEQKNGIEWKQEIFDYIKKTILRHFPDIVRNKYINADNSSFNRKYLELLMK